MSRTKDQNELVIQKAYLLNPCEICCKTEMEVKSNISDLDVCSDCLNIELEENLLILKRVSDIAILSYNLQLLKYHSPEIVKFIAHFIENKFELNKTDSQYSSKLTNLLMLNWRSNELYKPLIHSKQLELNIAVYSYTLRKHQSDSFFSTGLSLLSDFCFRSLTEPDFIKKFPFTTEDKKFRIELKEYSTGLKDR